MRVLGVGVLVLALGGLWACQSPVSTQRSTKDAPGPGSPVSALRITGFLLYHSLGAVHGQVDEASQTITATVPWGNSLATSLLPVVTHTGVSLTPEDDVFTNFTDPVEYVVAGPDGATRSYWTQITLAAAPKAIQTFIVPVNDDPVQPIGVINEANHTISVTVPKETDLTELAPVVTISGTTVQPASKAKVNFSTPVIYTVTGADGLTQDYTVTVDRSPYAGTKEITGIHFADPAPAHYIVTIFLDEISIGVVHGTDISKLVPVVAHTGKSISPVPGQVVNFAHSPVLFRVTAEDGTTRNYYVTVTVN